MELAGKTALVTGGGRNIGRAISLMLAKVGANVIVHGYRNEQDALDTAEAVRAMGRESEVALCDLGDAQALRQTCSGLVRAHGRVDIVINNAAQRPEKPFLKMTPEEWGAVLDVDMNAAFHTSQICLPGMIESGWGRIVNLTGMHAIRGYAGRAHVSAAKHGLWGLTKALAKEFAADGVTVNAVSPGPIRSTHHPDEVARMLEAQAAHVPMRRIGLPEEIAGLVAYLASPAGAFVSGQMIAANGAAET